MKSIASLLVLLAAANAAPIDQSVELMERQLGGASTRNDLVNGDAAACPGAIFIFARASGEDGNIVRSHDTVIPIPYILTRF
jgi:cutinase